MSPRHRNLPALMAKVLAETVPELSDPVACRRSLAFAGFRNTTIDKHLVSARNAARHLRNNEIEQRVRKERENT